MRVLDIGLAVSALALLPAAAAAQSSDETQILPLQLLGGRR